MSRGIHFIAKTIPGYGPPDGRYIHCSGVSASSCSSLADHKNSKTLKISSLKGTFRSTSYICNASSSGNRRNDFSRQNRQGFSRSRNRQYEERDGIENFEDSEIFTSKNGPLSTGPGSGSGSGPSKYHATATPGSREKEIVELFRKVQAQLREKATNKEEKKIEEAQGKGKENETVDSLLKLLRKHSVQQGKKTSNSVNTKEFILEKPEPSFFPEDKSINIVESNNVPKQEILQSEPPVTERPRSVFQKRSPIRQVKVENVNSVSHTDEGNLKAEQIDIPELEEIVSDMEQIFPDDSVFAEISEEIYETDKDKEDEELDLVESNELSEMKLTELKAIAKSRGLKGFSKLKKCELIELLELV